MDRKGGSPVRLTTLKGFLWGSMLMRFLYMSVPTLFAPFPTRFSCFPFSVDQVFHAHCSIPFPSRSRKKTEEMAREEKKSMYDVRCGMGKVLLGKVPSCVYIATATKKRRRSVAPSDRKAAGTTFLRSWGRRETAAHVLFLRETVQREDAGFDSNYNSLPSNASIFNPKICI